MRLYRDPYTSIDVQPKYAGRYLDAGWTRTPPKSSRRTRREPEPVDTAGDVSSDEGES